MTNFLQVIIHLSVLLILGIGTCCRGGIITLLYALLFVFLATASTRFLFVRHRILIRVFLICLALIGLASLILSAVANGSNNEALWARLLGYREYDDTWSYFQNIIPDASVIVVCGTAFPLLLIFDQKKTDPIVNDGEGESVPTTTTTTTAKNEVEMDVRRNEIDVEKAQVSKPKTTSSLQVFVIVIAIFSFFSFLPRVITMPFAFAFGIMIVLYAFTSLTMIRLVEISSLFLVPYGVCAYFFILLYQLEPLSDSLEDIPPYIGVGSFNDYFTSNGWTLLPAVFSIVVYIGFAAPIARKFVAGELVQESEKANKQYSPWIRWYYPRGWDFIVVVFLVLCLGVRGVIPFLLLLSSLVSTVLTNKVAAKFVYHSFVIEFGYFTLQLIFNIPDVMTGDIDDWENFGFVVYSDHFESLYFCTQSILMFALALFMRYDLGNAQTKSSLLTEEEMEEDEQHLIDSGSSSEFSMSSAATTLAKFNEKLRRFSDGLKIALGLFLTVLVSYSHVISLICVLFCSLTQASVINFIFMIFFLVFFVSPKLAHQFWPILVSYSQLVLLVLYAWQVTWSTSVVEDDSDVATVLGLAHYENLYLKLGWQALIFVFVMIQWRISDPVNTFIDDRGRRGVYYLISKNEPPKFVETIKKYYPMVSLWFVVIMFVVGAICIALLPSITIISVFYIAILCLMTYFAVVPVLSVSSVITAIIIGVRYAYQIEPLSEFVSDNYLDDMSEYFPLYDLGLTFWDDYLLSHFFPDIAMLVISVLLIRMLSTDKKDKDTNEAEKFKIELPHKLNVFLHLVLRFCFIFSPLGILIAASLTAINGDWNVMCFILLVLIVACLPKSKGNSAPGKALLFLSELYILMIYSGNMTWLDVAAKRFTRGITWIGIKRIERDQTTEEDPTDPNFGSLVDVKEPKHGYRLSNSVAAYVIIVFLSLLKYYLQLYMEKYYVDFENEKILEKQRRRQSKRMVRTALRERVVERRNELRMSRLKISVEKVEKEEKKGKDKKKFGSDSESESDFEDEKYFEFFSDSEVDLESRLLDKEKTNLRQIDLFSTPKGFDPLSTTEARIYYVKWYISNIFLVFRYPLCLICCCIALCCRAYDFLGYAYLFVLIIAIEKLSKRNSALKTTLVWTGFFVLAGLVLFQYVCAVGLPPPIEPDPNDPGEPKYDGLWPWHNEWSNTMQQLLLLAKPNYPIVLFADLCVLLTLTRLHIPSVGFFEFLESLASKYFPDKPHAIGDRVLTILIKLSPAIALLLVFVAGTARMDGMSLIYVFLSIYILMCADLLRNGRSKIWSAVRFINGFVILAQLVFYTVITVVGNFTSIPEGVSNVCSFIGFSTNAVSTTVAFNVFVLGVCAYHLSMYSYLADFVQKLVVKLDNDTKKHFDNASKLLVDEAKQTSELWENMVREQEKRTERVNMLRDKRLRKAKELESLQKKAKEEDESGFQTVPRRTITYALLFKEDFKSPTTVTEMLFEMLYWGIDRFITLFSSDRVAKILDAKEAEEADLVQIAHQKESLAQLEKQEAKMKKAEADRYKTAEEIKREELIRKKRKEYKKREERAQRKQEKLHKKEQKSYKKDVLRALKKRAREGNEKAIAILEQRELKKKQKKDKKLPSRLAIVWEMIMKGSVKTTKGFCVFVMVINNAVYGSVFSLVLVLIGFGYALLSKNPKPTRLFWNVISAFVIILAMLKFFFSMPGWCLTRDHLNGYDKFIFDINGVCPELPPFPTDEKAMYGYSWVYILGTQPRYDWFVFNAFWDILLIVMIFVHRSHMVEFGFWRPEMNAVRRNTRLRVAEFKTYLEVKAKRLLDIVMTKEDDDEKVYEATEIHRGKSVTFYDLVETSSENESEYSDDENHKDEDEKAPKRDRRNLRNPFKSKLTVDVRMLCDGTVEDSFVPINTLVFVHDRQPDPSLPWLGTTESGEEVKVNPCFAHVIKKDKKHIRHKRRLAEEYPMCSPQRDVVNLNRFVLFRRFKGLRKIVQPIYHYFNVLLYDPLKSGADLYTPLFVIDLICMIILILFPGDFCNTEEGVEDIMTSSIIPLRLVIVLIIQFAVIVLDRIVYLLKAVTIKLIMQYVTLVIYLIFFMWIFPHSSNTTFVSSFALIVVFLLKCCYWSVSAHQIREGYPRVIVKRFAMDGYTDLHGMIFSVYRAIPFLFEMRTVLDWALADTTLSIFNFFKFEAIYTQVYKNKCTIYKFRNKNRRIGSPRLISEKIGFGVLLFVGLCVLLWIPMLLLSSGGLTTETPPTTEVKLSVNYAGYLPLFEQTQHDFTKITSEDFNKLRENYSGIVKKDHRDSIEKTELMMFSEYNWQISDPFLNSLIDQLDNAVSDSFLTIAFTVSRKSVSSGTVTASYDVPLTPTQQHSLSQIITNPMLTDTLTLPDMLPMFLKMPGVTGDLQFPGSEVTASLGYEDNAATGSRFWVLMDENQQQLKFYIICATMPIGLTSSFASIGLIGLYTTYVVMIFSIVREFLGGSATNIPYENMNNVDDLLELIHDVLMARQMKDLILEESLFCELIELFRSPERLIDITKEKDTKLIEKKSE